MAEGRDTTDQRRVDASRELGELLEERDQLRSAIEHETYRPARDELRAQLRQKRKAIERLEDELGVDRRVPSPDTIHSQVVGSQAGNEGTQAFRGGVPAQVPTEVAPRDVAPRLKGQGQWSTLTVVLATLVGALLVALAVTAVPLYRQLSDPDEVDDGGEVEASPTLNSDAADQETTIRTALDELGIETVTIERRSSGLHLVGSVDSPEQRDVVTGIAQALARGDAVDVSAITIAEAGGVGGRAAALQAELNRTMASTPLIFASGQSELTEIHRLVLNTVASALKNFAEVPVNVVGYTDGSGTDEVNRQVSLVRAEAVRAYLVSQGVADENLRVEARGESASSGSGALAGLERRVEFEAQGAGGATTAQADILRIGIVAPSASNDAAFTQSLVDAMTVIGTEREIDVAVTDRTFQPDLAAEAVRGYAAEGFDLVIAHGSEYGTELRAIAEEFPDVTFAWGTATETFGLPNLYAYDAAAEEGGYIMGVISAIISESGVVGVVGPIEVGDAERYVNGFRAGVLAEDPTAEVLVTYTNSFNDTALAAQVANSHVAAGADVLTGTAEMVVGAVSVATENGIVWFGTQANQSSLDPTLVAGSQVYHWEVVLRKILADIDRGLVSGRGLELTLGNQGLVIEYNDGYRLPPEAIDRAAQLTTEIREGRVAPLR